jgi:hypothetical protein
MTCGFRFLLAFYRLEKMDKKNLTASEFYDHSEISKMYEKWLNECLKGDSVKQ